MHLRQFIHKSIFRHRHIWLLAVYVLAFSYNSKATHLVGGSITYTYKGVFNGKHRYDILLSIYRDCNKPPNQDQPTPFDPDIMLAIYEDNGDKPLLDNTWLSVSKSSEKKLEFFPTGSTCPDALDGVCVSEGFYRTTVDLPATSYGYHIKYVRCCRNTMLNVVDVTGQKQGQTYYAYIPPPSSTPNTSPSFTDVPVPYICIDDTASLLNTATEPDGDSLVFKLAHPYAGGDEFQPTPFPEDNFPTLPLINYNSGFSYINPFGANGIAKIDAQTGLTTVHAPKTGLYAIAIDVEEYRNGKLINTTRRDMQIIVIGCKKNATPERKSAGGTTSTTFFITAGEKFELPLKFQDDNNLVISASGELLDNINPKGSFSVTSGNKVLNTVFSWQTKCSYARAKPYILNLKVSDNGCPPKTINQTISIYVNPFKGTDKITGASPACQGSPGEKYSVIKKEGNSKIGWKVAGGKIISMSGEEIIIQWNDTTEGEIRVVEISENGCVGDTILRKIQIRPRPLASIISGDKIPCQNTENTYTVNALPGATYFWEVKGGTKKNTGANGKLNVLWHNEDSGLVSVIYRTAEGCYSDSAHLPIDIRGPIIDSIYGSVSVCPNSRGVDYWVSGREGSVYFWKVIGGKQNSGGNSDHIKVDWNEKGGGWIYAVEITKEGCISDTLKLFVERDYVLITSLIEGDTSLCEFVSGKKYHVVFSNGSTYEWKIIGGTIISGAGTAEITVNWDKSGTGFLTVEETAFDPINNKICKGKPVLLRISIYPLPATQSISGPDNICEFDSAKYYVSGLAESRFFWTIDGDTLFTSANYNDTFSIVATGDDFRAFVAGEHVIRVQEITKDSCLGDVLSFTVNLHPKPTTSFISGAANVCQPHLNGHVYKVKGSEGSVFEWNIAGGTITSGLGTAEITVDWTQAGEGELSVQEKSVFGCFGDIKRLPVRIDSLYLEIQRVTTGRRNEKVIELYWSAKNTQFLNKSIKIYRSRQGQKQYTLLDSTRPEQGYFIDSKVATDQYTYSYYLEAENICGEKVKSVPHTSILLQKQILNDTSGRIFWNRYEGWQNGVDYHYIFRRLNDDSTLVFHDLSKLDSYLYAYRGLDGYRQCYRVEAIKAQENDVVSWSNSVCFEFEPILWIPNAFTPDNNDLDNDDFRITLYNYKAFEITIFNRWGERIFHAEDPGISWNGTFKGVKCPQDVYLYTISVKGLHKNIYRSGTLHLLR